MAVTAAGTPYVETSDLVANYPGVSLALANHIDDLPAAVLQVVRATDSTNRSTTSTGFVDASISVTITPQKSTSAILLIYIGRFVAFGSNVAQQATIGIFDSSNNAISGAEQITFGGNDLAGGTKSFRTAVTLIGYATPATTSPVTYKTRFLAQAVNITAELQNSSNTGQMYAIEVSA